VASSGWEAEEKRFASASGVDQFITDFHRSPSRSRAPGPTKTNRRHAGARPAQLSSGVPFSRGGTVEDTTQALWGTSCVSHPKVSLKIGGRKSTRPRKTGTGGMPRAGCRFADRHVAPGKCFAFQLVAGQ
jgi:hypothetical protein